MMKLPKQFKDLFYAASLLAVASPSVAQESQTVPVTTPALPTPDTSTTTVMADANFLRTQELCIPTKRSGSPFGIPFIFQIHSTRISSQIDEGCFRSRQFIFDYQQSIDANSGAMLGLVSDRLNDQYSTLIREIAFAEAIIQPDSRDERGRRHSRSDRRRAQEGLVELQAEKRIIDEGITQDGRFPNFEAYYQWATENRLIVTSERVLSNDCSMIRTRELGSESEVLACGVARDRIRSSASVQAVPAAQP